MNITNKLGEITELRCQLDFVKRGISLSRPTNPSCRYDFIADVGGKLIRIQCKTCHLERNNVIAFVTSSKNWNNGERHDYVHDIDYFYTNWMNQGYLVPIDKCLDNMQSKTIRLGEERDYRFCKESVLYGRDVEIDRIINVIAPTLVYDVVDIESNAEQCFVNRRKDYVCKCCGAKTSVKNGMCWQCSVNSKRDPNKPSREELKQLIRTMPFTSIAVKYDKSDNAIRKWCTSYNLPAKASIIKAITDDEWANV